MEATSEANACTSLITHIEKHNWLGTCHMEIEIHSEFTKKSDSCDRLITTNYNHTFTKW